MVALSDLGGVWPLVVAIGLFFITFGLIAANGTTLALQPHAAAAGAAAAALGFGQTVVPALIGGGVAVLYDGTALPMLATILAPVRPELAGRRVPARTSGLFA